MIIKIRFKCIRYFVGLLAAISAASVTGAMKIQNVSTVAKLFALFIVVLLGLYHLLTGNQLFFYYSLI